MQPDDKLKEAIELYNIGKYLDSHRILIVLWVQSDSAEKQLCEALLKVAEGMNFVENHEWEKAKDIFLDAWRKLQEVNEEMQFLDVERLKEEAYTAAVAAERIILGEAEDFDPFYIPKVALR